MRAPDPAVTARLRSLSAPPVAAGPPEVEPPEVETDDAPTEELPLVWAPPTTLSGYVRASVRSRLPTSLQGGHVDPGRRGALLVAALGLLTAVVAIGWAVHGRAHPVAPTTVAAQVPGGADPLTAVPPVQVDVEGRVRRPGLVKLPGGSRVADAIAAAGGALPSTDTSGLDLAQKVTDGQQLRVGAPPAPVAASSGPASSGSSASGSAGPGGLVDLNTATADQLETLPRVGPATAQKILDYRTAHGSFTSVDQLQQVSGIGPATYQQLAPLVTV